MKRFFSLLFIFSVLPITAQEMTDEQLKAAYEVAAQDQLKYQSAIGVSALTGGLIGGLAGGRATVGLGSMAGINAVQGNKITQSGYNLALIGATTGGYTGVKAGSKLGQYGALRYYTYKYGVSKPVAHIALLIAEPLSIPSIKQLFIDAENKNDQALKDFLTNYYFRIFGKEWHSALRKIIDHCKEIIFRHGSIKAKEEAQKNKILRQFEKSTNLTWGLSTLYFEDNIFNQDEDFRSFKTRLIATENLLNKLGIE